MDPTSMDEVHIPHCHKLFVGLMMCPADLSIHSRLHAFFEYVQAGQKIFIIHVPDT
jgi:hypothetical protein